MKTIATQITDIHSFFQVLKSDLGGTLTTNEKEHTFEVDSSVGNGSIRSSNLEDGITVLEFKLKVNEDTEIAVDGSLGTHVNFMYCSKGKLSHRFGDNDSRHTIETFQTSIMSNIVSSRNLITLEKNVETVATLITVNTGFKGTRSSQWNMGLKKLFIDDRREDYLYVGSYNLKIAESIKQLQSIKQEGIVRELLIKGVVNVILALEIEHYTKDIENIDTDPLSLTKSEIKMIGELTDYINEFPDLDHKVELLSDRVGLSAVKLQEGFKFQHGLTVCEYIRHVRLTKSEDLIINTDLNISEIVYSVGFTSRSYFSKIFKERFDCTPSDYKKNKLAVSA